MVIATTFSITIFDEDHDRAPGLGWKLTVRNLSSLGNVAGPPIVGEKEKNLLQLKTKQYLMSLRSFALNVWSSIRGAYEDVLS